MTRRRGLLAVGIVLGLGLPFVVPPVRHAVLEQIGRMLVAEDEVAAVELVALSGASLRAGAFEAAEWVRAGRAQVVLIPNWPLTLLERRTRDLGVTSPSVMELAHDILVRSGVPESAVLVAEQPADGTGREVAAIGTTVVARGAHSCLYLTDPTHTARARWLLRRAVPPGIAVAVRSPRAVQLDVTGWWRDRAMAREVAVEYLRWANDLLLGDPWRRWGPAAASDPEPG